MREFEDWEVFMLRRLAQREFNAMHGRTLTEKAHSRAWERMMEDGFDPGSDKPGKPGWMSPEEWERDRETLEMTEPTDGDRLRDRFYWYAREEYERLECEYKGVEFVPWDVERWATASGRAGCASRRR